jgi:hypothetical protein
MAEGIMELVTDDMLERVTESSLPMTSIRMKAPLDPEAHGPGCFKFGGSSANMGDFQP